MLLPGKNGPVELDDGLVQAYRAVHQNADVEFAKMRIWLELNASRRPKNVLRFVNTWFKRCRRVETSAALAYRAVRQSRDAELCAALTGKHRVGVIDV